MKWLDNYLNVINFKKDELINDVTTNSLSIPKELKESVNAILKTGIENKDILLNKDILEKS